MCNREREREMQEKYLCLAGTLSQKREGTRSCECRANTWKWDTKIQVWHHPPNQGMLSGTNPVCNHQLSSLFHQSNLQNSEPGKKCNYVENLAITEGNHCVLHILCFVKCIWTPIKYQ